jgi:hypothetical protein
MARQNRMLADQQQLETKQVCSLDMADSLGKNLIWDDYPS